MTDKTEYQKEYNKLVFGDKKKIELTPENIEPFLEKCSMAGTKLNKKIQTDQDRVFDIKEVKPEDLEMVAKRLINEIASFCNQADYVQLIKDLFEKGDKRFSPRYKTQEDVDKYKIEVAKLFESLILKLRLATFFGFGEIESSIGFVDMSKLPSLEEAKKLDRSKIKEYLEKAVDKKGKIENCGVNIFKEENDQNSSNKTKEVKT